MLATMGHARQRPTASELVKHGELNEHMLVAVGVVGDRRRGGS